MRKKITNTMFKNMLENLYIEGVSKYKALEFLENRGMKWSTFHIHWKRMEGTFKPDRVWKDV